MPGQQAPGGQPGEHSRIRCSRSTQPGQGSKAQSQLPPWRVKGTKAGESLFIFPLFRIRSSILDEN